MGEVQEVQAGVVRSVGGDLVEFGPVVNGVVVPFAAIRSGDYDEAVAAAAQTQPQPQQTQQEGS